MQIKNIMFNQKLKSITFFVDYVDRSSQIHNKSTVAIYIPEFEQLTMFKDGVGTVVLCSGLDNIIEYIEMYGNIDIAEEFVKSVLDITL